MNTRVWKYMGKELWGKIKESLYSIGDVGRVEKNSLYFSGKTWFNVLVVE